MNKHESISENLCIRSIKTENRHWSPRCCAYPFFRLNFAENQQFVVWKR